MTFDLTRRPNVKLGITIGNYCAGAKKDDLKVSVIRAVDETESAGSGFLSGSKRPKILFEGHYFYKFLKRVGKAEQGRHIDSTICYPTWTKAHYIGREGEYQRLAKAIQICHTLTVPEALALRSASWGRYQIMGDHYQDSGFNSIEDFCEAMFHDEALHLDAFLEYIDSADLLDVLQKLPTNPAHYAAVFANGYNGSGYRRNQYDVKIANSFRKFDKMVVDCNQNSDVHTVAAMPGVRDANPGDTGFANTSLDDRHLTTDDEPTTLTGDITGSGSNLDTDTDTDTDTDMDDDDNSDTQTEQPAASSQPELPSQPAASLNDPPIESGAAPGATVDDKEKSPQIIDKERPSLFSRVMTGIIGTIGTAFAGLTSWCGSNEVANTVAQKGADRVSDNVTSHQLLTLGVVLAYLVIGVGAGVFLLWVASKIWERATFKAHQLNVEKIKAAASQALNTVEFKK